MSSEVEMIGGPFKGNAEIGGYFRHFGLKRDPFGIEEKETSLYLLPNWEQQIDLMLHYIRHENVLLALTGPKGIGKTTFVNFFLLEAIHGFSPTETAVQSDLVSGEFLVQLGDVVRTCQVIADSALNPEQMLEVMTGAFDISIEHFLGNFEAQCDLLLEKLQYCKQNCVLLIDEAQELPEVTFELLVYMINQQSETQHRLHIVLIGETGLKKRLTKINKSKDYQGLIHCVDLEPLNLSQTEYYLRHRFSAAGLEDKMPFSNGMINKIYKLSGGIPKIINQLARQSMLDMLKKKKFSSLGAVFKPYKKTFIGGTFLLASFAIILLYLGQDMTLRSQPKPIYHETIPQKKPALSVPKPVLLPPGPMSSSPQRSIQPTTVGAQSPDNQVITETAPPRIAQTLAPQMQVSQATTMSSSAPLQQGSGFQPLVTQEIAAAQSQVPPAQVSPPQIPRSQVLQPQPLQPQVLRPPANVKPEVQASTVFSAPSKSVVESGSLIEPNSQTTQEPEVKAPLLPPSEKLLPQRHKEAMEKVVPPVVEPKEEKSTAEQAETHLSTKPIKQSEDSYTRRLMKASPKHYTLRLTEVASKSAGKAFIAKHKLGSNASYYRVRGEGADRYVVVYGEYANLETTRQAISFLPQSLQEFAPEPYRMSKVQSDIRQANTKTDE